MSNSTDKRQGGLADQVIHVGRDADGDYWWGHGINSNAYHNCIKIPAVVERLTSMLNTADCRETIDPDKFLNYLSGLRSLDTTQSGENDE